MKGLLKSAIRDPNPVVFIEHLALVCPAGRGANERIPGPYRQGCVRRSGTDVTIAAYSYMTTVALRAAAELGESALALKS